MKKAYPRETKFSINNSEGGESLEKELQRVKQEGGTIESTVPKIFTARGEGVVPDLNIRTDRWDVAVEAMNVVHRSQTAKKMDKFGFKGENEKKDSGTEPTGGTNN